MTEPPSSIPTLAESGIDKKLSSRAQKLAAVSEEKFEELIEDWREKVHVEEKRVTANLLKEGKRVQRDEKLSVLSLPNGLFSVIYADPPWTYEFSETISREIENQYPTMELEEIKRLSIPSADASVLFLWATAPKLKEALEVLEAWGFEYVTNAVWDKEKIGMGYWFRGQHELLLVGKKGTFSPPSPSARISSVIRIPRTSHSKKPQEIYQMIETMFPGEQLLEVFAREKREGWESWGNQL